MTSLLLKLLCWPFKSKKKKGPNPRDFEHRCAFPSQLNYKGLDYGRGEEVEVPMSSGRVGIFKCNSTPCFGDTGQRSWHFTFLRYKDEV
jgi:hypothetical protein